MTTFATFETVSQVGDVGGDINVVSGVIGLLSLSYNWKKVVPWLIVGIE